MSRGGCSQT
eukprot:gene3996-biopygen12344